nr:transposase [Rhodococcus pyridinivorans]
MVMKAYSAEFKADAVALYLSDPSHTFEGIGKDLGVSRETLRNWVRAERKRTGTASAADRPRKPAPAGGVGVPVVMAQKTTKFA